MSAWLWGWGSVPARHDALQATALGTGTPGRCQLQQLSRPQSAEVLCLNPSAWNHFLGATPAKLWHGAVCVQAARLQQVLERILAFPQQSTRVTETLVSPQSRVVQLPQSKQSKARGSSMSQSSFKTGPCSASHDGQFPNLRSSTALVPLQIPLIPTKAKDNGSLSIAQC